MSLEESLEVLKKLKNIIQDLNEADTRFHIIDEILTKVFFWPHSNIKLEKYTHEGYMDYILKNDGGKNFLVIEAKN